MLDLQSWKNRPLLISLNGEKLGYVSGSELLLNDEKYLPSVIKALFSFTGADSIKFVAGLDQKARIAYVKDIAEYSSLGPQEMIRVLNWERTLKLFLEFKHKHVCPIQDGCAELDIAGEGAFSVDVTEGKAEVKRLAATTENTVSLDLLSAQRAFFGVPEMLMGLQGIPQSWLGLPFYMSEQDGF